MSIETEAQFEGMKAIGAIVANCLEVIKAAARPGMTTQELDFIGAKFLKDHGGSFVLGQGSIEKKNLCVATQRALKLALKYVSDGIPLNQMAKEIQNFVHRQGLTVIENVGGHGVGKSLHEEPEFIANFFVKNDRRVFKENTVVAIEPIISTGAKILMDKGDGWTLHHPDFFTAQFEHTVMVTKGRPFIFARPSINVA